MLERRRGLSSEARRAAASAVCDRLESWGPVHAATAVAGYLAFDNEVDVSAFLERRLEAGSIVALPRVEDGESMEYVDVDDLEDVQEGSFGIMEPTGGACELGELEIFLVPGVAFDRSGGRIGMGWGYYDRALADRRSREGRDPIFVGICYDWQLVDSLPTEPHDVDMDAVVAGEDFLVVSDDFE